MHLRILLAILALCCACSQPQAYSTSYRGEVSTLTGELSKGDEEEETVYITKTGRKYHAAGCRHLSKSKIPIELSKAKARYGACSVCGS